MAVTESLLAAVVRLRFHNGEVADFSGLEALRELRELFQERKKELRVAMLSESSKKMIDKAAGLFGEVEYSEKEITGAPLAQPLALCETCA